MGRLDRLSFDTTNRDGASSLRAVGGSVLRLVPAAGYVGAQVILVIAWIRWLKTIGVGEPLLKIDGLINFLIVALATWIPAAFLGILDGIARVLNYLVLRILIAILLILFTGYWITMMGHMSLDTTDFYGRQSDVPSLQEYVGVLIGMELALALEWVIGVIISNTVALVRAWRQA